MMFASDFSGIHDLLVKFYVLCAGLPLVGILAMVLRRRQYWVLATAIIPIAFGLLMLRSLEPTDDRVFVKLSYIGIVFGVFCGLIWVFLFAQCRLRRGTQTETGNHV